MSTAETATDPREVQLEAAVRIALAGDPSRTGAVGPLQEYGEALRSEDPAVRDAAMDGLVKAIAARLAAVTAPQPSQQPAT